MDHQKRLDRINELAHKHKSIGLTEEEKAEQKKLRAEYLSFASVKKSMLLPPEMFIFLYVCAVLLLPSTQNSYQAAF